MSADLLDVIFNQVIGAIIGTLVSFAVAWYFYQKSDVPTQVTQAMIRQLALAITQSQFGGEFIEQVIAERDTPKDKDVPHITELWISIEAYRAANQADIIMRVVDKGLNFNGEVEGLDVQSETPLKITRRGYGLFSTRLPAQNTAVAPRPIRFRLTDMAGKAFDQLIALDTGDE